MGCAAMVMADDTACQVNKVAASMILDFYLPDWRKNAVPDVLGCILSRVDDEVWKWRQTVLSRDGFKCQSCQKETELHVHHILAWSEFPSMRIVTGNGITLCKTCHREVHSHA